jgi:hypothetical protein
MWKFFNKQKEQPIARDNNISFTSAGGKSWVSVDIGSMDDKALKDFAEILFYINTGQYQTTITNILVSLCDQKPEIADKFETVLKQWLLLETTYEKSLEKAKINDPLIYPRDVFLGTEK